MLNHLQSKQNIIFFGADEINEESFTTPSNIPSSNTLDNNYLDYYNHITLIGKDENNTTRCFW
jgi:hypothetical protein